MRAFASGAALGLLLLGAAAPAAAQRVVSLGGAVTEIVYALGAGERLVGVDSSSVYPPAAARLPKVGYYRSFAIEGVASLRPELVLAADQAGPPQALAQLRALGLPVRVLPSAPTLEALEQRITGVADALQVPERGAALLHQLRAELPRPQLVRRRVLLVSSHSGRLEGAGADTSADALLRLAGATNVLAATRGYKPLSAEATAALEPDLIVTTAMSVAALGGLDAFIAQPGIAATSAARARRVLVMDELLLLGFGPRLPEALRQLQAGLTGAH